MKTLQFAIKSIIPLLFSYIFVGIAFGILMNEAGYSMMWTVLAATFIYAGSMQIVMISLLTSGASLLMAAVMTFFVNARLMFYGIGLVERFRKMGWKYPYMVLTLTDEIYSVFCSAKVPKDVNQENSDFYIALICHLLWIASCVAGALFGELVPFDLPGIEFSATAFFLTVCVNQWRELDSRIPSITGLISGVIFYIFIGPQNFILPALSVSLIVLLMMKDRILLKMEGGKHVS